MLPRPWRKNKGTYSHLSEKDLVKDTVSHCFSCATYHRLGIALCGLIILLIFPNVLLLWSYFSNHELDSRATIETVLGNWRGFSSYPTAPPF